MSMPTVEELRALAEVFIQWGFGFMVFGAITMLIGLIIVVCLDVKTIKKITQFLHN